MLRAQHESVPVWHDPFAEMVSVTSLRTVGDLLRAYADALEGTAPRGA